MTEKPGSIDKIAKPGMGALLVPHTRAIAILVILAIAGNALSLLIPLIISGSIDDWERGTFSWSNTAIRFSATATGILLLTYLQNIIQAVTAEKVALRLRSDISEQISRQSYTYVIRANPSRLLSFLTGDVDSVKLFVSQAIVSILSSVFIIIGASAMLISIHWKLGLAVITIIPLIGTVFFLMFRKVKVLFKKSRENIDRLNRIINESILGAMLIRVLNSQHFEYKKFIEANTVSRELGMAILSLFAALIPIITFVSNLAMLAVLSLGGHLVIRGDMTLGNLAAFNAYIALLIFPILVIGFMSNMIAQASASYARISEVLQPKDSDHKGSLSHAIGGSIDLIGISLLHEGKHTLKNIHLKVPQGSRTAIIGPTAAGKTQLLYLIAGLTQPDAGEILVDGIPLKELDQSLLHRQVGIVFQDSILFNLSLRENIAFSKDATDEQLEMAIETAELAAFISSLPQGLDTEVAERGMSLSGGQKQRIMLARALAIRPRILLLDDFTARVDKRTEHRILENIKINYPGLTVVSVTQRIASIESAENIVLLMEGEMVGCGLHADLMQTCPEYVQIYKSQRSTSHYEL